MQLGVNWEIWDANTGGSEGTICTPYHAEIVQISEKFVWISSKKAMVALIVEEESQKCGKIFLKIDS